MNISTQIYTQLTLWMECLKLVNVLKSTFLGSEFHPECLVIKMKKNSTPVPIFYQTATRSTEMFLLGLTSHIFPGWVNNLGEQLHTLLCIS